MADPGRRFLPDSEEDDGGDDAAWARGHGEGEGSPVPWPGGSDLGAALSSPALRGQAFRTPTGRVGGPAPSLDAGTLEVVVSDVTSFRGGGGGGGGSGGRPSTSSSTSAGSGDASPPASTSPVAGLVEHPPPQPTPAFAAYALPSQEMTAMGKDAPLRPGYLRQAPGFVEAQAALARAGGRAGLDPELQAALTGMFCVLADSMEEEVIGVSRSVALLEQKLDGDRFDTVNHLQEMKRSMDAERAANHNVKVAMRELKDHLESDIGRLAMGVEYLQQDLRLDAAAGCAGGCAAFAGAAADYLGGAARSVATAARGWWEAAKAWEWNRRARGGEDGPLTQQAQPFTIGTVSPRDWKNPWTRFERSMHQEELLSSSAAAASPPDADFATPYTPLSDGPLLDNRRTPS